MATKPDFSKTAGETGSTGGVSVEQYQRGMDALGQSKPTKGFHNDFFRNVDTKANWLGAAWEYAATQEGVTINTEQDVYAVLVKVAQVHGVAFTPVQQGGGPGQGTNKIKVGWGAASKLLVQVDSTDFGAQWPIDISGSATKSVPYNSGMGKALQGYKFGRNADDSIGHANWLAGIYWLDDDNMYCGPIDTSGGSFLSGAINWKRSSNVVYVTGNAGVNADHYIGTAFSGAYATGFEYAPFRTPEITTADAFVPLWGICTIAQGYGWKDRWSCGSRRYNTPSYGHLEIQHLDEANSSKIWQFNASGDFVSSLDVRMRDCRATGGVYTAGNVIAYTAVLKEGDEGYKGDQITDVPPAEQSAINEKHEHDIALNAGNIAAINETLATLQHKVEALEAELAKRPAQPIEGAE